VSQGTRVGECIKGIFEHFMPAPRGTQYSPRGTPHEQRVQQGAAGIELEKRGLANVLEDLLGPTRHTIFSAGQTPLAMSFCMVCGVQKKTRLEAHAVRRVPCSSFFVLPIGKARYSANNLSGGMPVTISTWMPDNTVE